jgi:threonine/homoserine/homoserine lactone efflux protein
VTASIPLALAIAASPFAIMPAIMLLLTPRPRAASGAFLAAWFLGVAGVTAIAVVAADVAEEYEPSPTWASWARVTLGIVVAGLAAKTWMGRRTTKQPAWMAAISSASPRKAFGLGFLLSAANPKVIALAVAGGAVIGSADVEYSREALYVVAFAAIASVSVAAPLAVHIVAGKRAVPLLERVRSWLDRHSAAITAVVLAAIAVALVASGTSALQAT